MSNKLLNKTMEVLELKNDRHLATAVGVAPPVISKIRHGHLKVGAVLILRIHKLTNIPVREIEELIATPTNAGPKVVCCNCGVECGIFSPLCEACQKNMFAMIGDKS